jgi:hypothetical protein
MVVGAILAIAVDDNVPDINLGAVGVILLVAGAFVIAHARHGVQREQVTSRLDTTDPADPRVVKEVVRERDTEV